MASISDIKVFMALSNCLFSSVIDFFVSSKSETAPDKLDACSTRGLSAILIIMRFLIVGCFKRDGERQLAYWTNQVKNTIEGCPQIGDLSNDYISLLDSPELDLFLTDPNSGSAADSRSFDLLDVVVVVADSVRMPWSPSNQRVVFPHKVLKLVRNCIEVNKPLFLSGSAALTLVFLCASNLDGPVKILNNSHPPKPVEDFFDKKTTLPNEILLCPKTGDIYLFVPTRNLWEPRYNTG